MRTKPTCQNCITQRRVCIGANYLVTEAEPRPRLPANEPVIPQTKLHIKSNNNEKKLFFQSFTKSVKEITGTSDHSFRLTGLRQIAQNHRAIWHGALAISVCALDQLILVVACIVLSCLCIMQADRRSSLPHMWMGAKLIRQWWLEDEPAEEVLPHGTIATERRYFGNCDQSFGSCDEFAADIGSKITRKRNPHGSRAT